MSKIFYGPILYFQMKSYIKGVLWLIFILFVLPVNVFAGLLFWMIAGWFGKRKLARGQVDKSSNIPSAAPSRTHKPQPEKAQIQSQAIKYQDIEIPVLQKFPEGPGYGLAGFIDVETTGLNEKKDQIIELAISLLCFEKDTCKIVGIVDSYCGLREPTIPIPAEASRINGIYMHDVKGKDLDYEQVNYLFNKADFFISHNADFDRSFVRVLFPSVDSKKWLCSMNGINWYGKGSYSKGLQNLLSLHSIRPRSAHRASGDVESTIKLLACTAENGESYFSELIKGQAKLQKPSMANSLGYYNGKHYTEYKETVKTLRREEKEDLKYLR